MSKVENTKKKFSESSVEIARSMRVHEIFSQDITLKVQRDSLLNRPSSTSSLIRWEPKFISILDQENNDDDRCLVQYKVKTSLVIAEDLEEDVTTPLDQERELDEEAIIATLDVDFIVIYLTTKNFLNLSKFEKSVIGKTRVCIDIWPYWQETSSQLAYRSRLPPVVMPPFSPDMVSLASDSTQPKTDK